MLNPKQRGNLTELQCISAFYEHGCHVSIPFGENSRYDFIADVEGKLLRVQVKTSSSKKNTSDAIEFSCRSSYLNTKGVRNAKYTDKEIDYFATYWKNVCYIVPVSECSDAKTLRFAPPANGQTKGITFACDYELGNQLIKIKEEVAKH